MFLRLISDVYTITSAVADMDPKYTGTPLCCCTKAGSLWEAVGTEADPFVVTAAAGIGCSKSPSSSSLSSISAAPPDSCDVVAEPFRLMIGLYELRDIDDGCVWVSLEQWKHLRLRDFCLQ